MSRCKAGNISIPVVTHIYTLDPEIQQAVEESEDNYKNLPKFQILPISSVNKV